MRPLSRSLAARRALEVSARTTRGATHISTHVGLLLEPTGGASPRVRETSGKRRPPPPGRAGGRAQARAQAKPSTSEHGAEQQVWGWWARAQAGTAEHVTG